MAMRSLVAEILSDLVSINSVNPRFAGRRSGPGGEAEIMRALQSRLAGIGLETWTVEATRAGRPSLVARLAGSGGGRSLMLNGHADTVGVETYDDPFEPRIEGDRLYGRGAYDMKGGVAACLAAVFSLAEEGPRLAGDLWFSAVADEEDASLGARAVSERFPTDGVLVAEPTEMAIAFAHKGFVWVEASTEGFACHGSLAERGVDANRRIAPVFAALDALERERSGLSHHALGRASLHVGRIEGGLGPSIYSPSCRLTVELRTLPGESPEALVERLRELVAQARERDDYAIAIEPTLVRPPLESDPGGALGRALSAAIEAPGAEAGPFIGVPYWTDAAFFARTSAEVLLYGPSGDGAHEDVEWVDLSSVATVAETLRRTALGYCG